MPAPKTHSIEELEKLTGFNQRTIAYYIQQGLLPKVGRRGPSTRYPHLFVDRLSFIQRVRELQDAGRLGSVTLPRIAAVIWYLVRERGPDVALAELDEPEIERLFGTGGATGATGAPEAAGTTGADSAISEHRDLGETEAGQAVSASFGKFGPYVRAGETTASIEADEFFDITRDEALERIRTEEAEKVNRVMREFDEAGIRVIDGRFGPYVTDGRTNANVPRGRDPLRLTLAESRELLEKRREKLSGRRASARREVMARRFEDVEFGGVREPEVLLALSEEEPVMEMMLEPMPAAKAPAKSVRVGAGKRPGDTAAVSELRWLVRELQMRAQLGKPEEKGKAGDLWTRVPLVDGLELFVRADNPKDSKLVERIAGVLRGMLEGE